MPELLSRRTWLKSAGISAAVLATQRLGAEGHQPIDIGSRVEPLVDDHLIEQFSGGARLKLHHPTPREVALRFDQPWEGNTSGYATVMRDDGRFVMIYRGHRMVWDSGKLIMGNSPVVCYAESRDGITWEKPNLGLFPWRGKNKDQLSDPTANNIVWPGSPYSGTFVPFLDTNPSRKAAEKFKAVGGNQHVGLFLFTSPDAIHWTISEEPIFNQGALDSMNVVFWDELEKRYFLYFRVVENKLRGIAVTSSTDLRTWTEPVSLEYPGSPPQQMYTNQIVPYFRAPHIRMGFPTRYTARPMTDQLQSLPPKDLRAELTGAYARVGSDLTDGLFMSSRDGVRFQRWDEAFLRPGPQAGDAESRWMYGDNYQSYGLFETASSIQGAPNEVSMLFSEGYWREGKSLMRRYTVRLDGFASVHTPFAGGEMVTRPLRFSGNRLRLNYATSAAGSVKVELQDVEGKVLAGYSLDDCQELIGDRVDQIVRWQAGEDIGALSSNPVRVRFVMRDSDLYSMKFAAVS